LRGPYVPLDPQTGIHAGNEAPVHPLGSLDGPGEIQHRVTHAYGDVIVGAVGTLVVASRCLLERIILLL
jgi:hypothetical protein